MCGHFVQDTEWQLGRVALFFSPCFCSTSDSLRNMASWEPAVDVLIRLATLKEVAEIVAMPQNVSALLFAALGATEVSNWTPGKNPQGRSAVLVPCVLAGSGPLGFAGDSDHRVFL